MARAKRKCVDFIEFGDDYMDNSTTFHCQLEAGHEGQHQEKGDMGYGEQSIPYLLVWDYGKKEVSNGD